MTETPEIVELKRQNSILLYENHFLNQRLSMIRTSSQNLERLIHKDLPQEALKKKSTVI